MAWLSDWSKRIKFTVDSWYVDENLTDFPLLVTLISGTNSADVFNELSTVSGTKKIAVTTDNGTSQCYVEIERWDWSAEEVNLWVRIPTVYSGIDTTLYLYYDSTKNDNIYYIGDMGSTVAQEVWDDNFVGVYHMGQEPVGAGADSIINSARIANQGTPSGYTNGPNVALSKTAAQSSTNSIHVASNAVDGNTSTFQSTNTAANEWWKVDLGDVYFVSSIQMYKRSGYGTRPSYYYIQIADDWDFTVNVVNIITENNETSSGSWITWDTDDFGSISTRYVRVYAHTVSQYLNIAEFKVNIFSLTNGKIGNGIYFDGDDDEISLGTHTSLDTTSAFTYEVIFKSSTAVYQNIINKYDYDGGDYQMELHINAVGSVVSNIYNSVLTVVNCNTDNGLGGNYLDGDYYYVATNIDISAGDGKNRLYINGILNVTSSNSIVDINSLASIPTNIGEKYNSSSNYYMTGLLDEIRISNIKRTDAWIKANYYNLWDELITFYTQETAPTHYYDGYVTEEGNPVIRTVRLYYRDTGELIDETTSSGVGGYYYLTTTISGEHFIVAFDDDLDESYNALILDKLLPRGIE